MARKKRVFENQRLFTPKVIRRFTNSSGVLRNQTKNSLSGSDPSSVTGSFRFDTPGMPIKSSQQLPYDFSKFENHTFFSSAATNVNVVFEKIINNFPFDGKKKDYEEWLDSLTGYELWVLKNYPQYTGYITLHGNNEYVEIIDKAGVVFPSISRISTGETILNPKGNPVFVEIDVALPPAANAKQYIFYQVSDSNVGYSAYVRNDSSTHRADVVFTVLSGTDSLSVSTPLEKGKFNKLAFYYDVRPGERRAGIVSGSSVVARSERFKFGAINTEGANFLLGTGSAFSSTRHSFVPTQTFSGSLDNLRVFHKMRKLKEVAHFEKRIMFAEQEPRLLFRFNEATGSYSNNDVILDHSGNSLHSKISGFATSIRSEKPYPSLVRYEGAVYNPTLFPSHPDVVNLNKNLLYSASQYDANNPNLITKLIPQHYIDVARQSLFAVGTAADGNTMEGIQSQAATYALPGVAKIGQPQIIASLLFMWARMFDELKIMLDHVSNLTYVDYDKSESVADQFLPFVAEYYGFDLPNMYRNADYNQFFKGEDVTGTQLTVSLQAVQNEMWRRILINIKDVFSTKGTKYAIKSIFRAVGIDPDRLFRFVEYGGPANYRLGQSRQKITEISTMTDFSGSLTNRGPEISQGFYTSGPRLISTYLSSSRTEVGWPHLSGTFVDKSTFKPHGISNVRSDGMLTSGSWTVENRFKFPITRQYWKKQSILRMHFTGSNSGIHQAVALNVVADPDNDNMGENPTLTLYCRPGGLATDPLLTLPLTGANIFDGSKWYIAVGRERNDAIGSFVSSSYFMTIARQDNGSLREYHTTSSWFNESTTRGRNLFQAYDLTPWGGTNTINASGSFVVVGEQNIDTTQNLYLNSTSVPSTARETKFSGLAGHTRFWSKSLSTAEKKEHALSFQSLGVKDPLVNFSFANEVTGAFNRLRLDISTDQPITASDSSGALSLVDFSQQLASGSIRSGGYLRGFASTARIIKPERFDYSIISSNYDEVNEDNKVRISGFTQGQNLFDLGGRPAPVYEIPKATTPTDDSRFAIEFSMMQALDEDIMKIFATLDSLDNIIGAPELMFAEEYPGLRDLRNVYFNRLTGTVNYKNFFDFFRWLDDSFDVMIEKLIPRKTNYLGFNFVIESHALERAKITYHSGDVYLGPSERRNLKGIILLRQLIAQVRKI